MLWSKWMLHCEIPRYWLNFRFNVVKFTRQSMLNYDSKFWSQEGALIRILAHEVRLQYFPNCNYSWYYFMDEILVSLYRFYCNYFIHIRIRITLCFVPSIFEPLICTEFQSAMTPIRYVLPKLETTGHFVLPIIKQLSWDLLWSMYQKLRDSSAGLYF